MVMYGHVEKYIGQNISGTASYRRFCRSELILLASPDRFPWGDQDHVLTPYGAFPAILIDPG